MINSPKKCILCKNGFVRKTINYLDMKECKKCRLVWRDDFDLDLSHYKNQGLGKIDLNNEKILKKISNMRDRIRLFSRFVDLNNLCDIGTGKGLFLRELNNQGYKNIIGIEPNSETTDFYKENNLKVYNRTIESGINDLILDNKIRVVTMFHIIEHLSDPFSSVRKIYNDLPKGSYLIIETPDLDSYAIKKVNYKNKLIYKEHLYYFNKYNLEKLLVMAGFSVVRFGKRDFNQYDLPIKESLFRLGLLKKNKEPQKNINQKLDIYSIDKKQSKDNKSFFKKNIGKFLSRIVVLTGRLNYIWFVVEKK